MELDKWQDNTNIVIENINVERVQSFQYLGPTCGKVPVKN